MRSTFSDTLVSLAQMDPNVLLLTGDHGYALFDAFRSKCPDQYINAGIAEQNMAGMAAGLARAGFRPFVYGLAAFVPVRIVEQIKLDIAHDDLPVVLCGDGAGFVYSHLGTSHQSTEDIACTRAIPGLSIYSPADRFELRTCMVEAYESARPAYIRMGKADRGDVHAGELDRPVTLLQQIRTGDNPVVFLATGAMARTALDIRDKSYPDAAVWTVPCIKPLDEATLIALATSSTLLCVLEEHSTIGGLGAAVAEVTSSHAPVRILRIGVKDRFSLHCGTYDYLLKEHGLDVDSVAQSVAAAVSELNRQGPSSK